MMQKWDDPDDSPEGIAPEDGPSRFCLGRSCAESQIILARMLLIAPLLYAGWCASPTHPLRGRRAGHSHSSPLRLRYLFAAVISASFEDLPLSGTVPFKHERFVTGDGASEANARLAFDYRVGRGSGPDEYRPLTAWLSMVLTNALLAPWLIFLCAHDSRRAVDYSSSLQSLHVILVTGIMDGLPDNSCWWLTMTGCWLWQSQVATLLLSRCGSGRSGCTRRLDWGPRGAGPSLPVGIATEHVSRRVFNASLVP